MIIEKGNDSSALKGLSFLQLGFFLFLVKSNNGGENLRQVGGDCLNHGDTGETKDETENVVSFIHVSASGEDGLLHRFHNRVSNSASSFAKVVVRRNSVKCFAIWRIIRSEGAIEQFTKTARDVKLSFLSRSWNFEIKDVSVHCRRSKNGSVVDEFLEVQLRLAKEFGQLRHHFWDFSRCFDDVFGWDLLRGAHSTSGRRASFATNPTAFP